MLSDDEFSHWAERLSLADATRALTTRIRTGEPVRLVQGGFGNVSGRWPSWKMKRTIQFESETELYRIIRNEVDDDVLEFYDQPYRLKLSFKKDGRKRGQNHAVDFFEIRRDRAVFVECKTEKELASKPELFLRDAEGRWTCPPGAVFAEQFGLAYRVFADSEVKPTFKRNASLLRVYWQRRYPIAPEERERILSLVHERPGLSLAELFEGAGPQVTRDGVYALIAGQDVFVDLEAAWLGDIADVRLFSERDVARGYQLLTQSVAPSPGALDPIKQGDRVTFLSRPCIVVSAKDERVQLLDEEGRSQWLAIETLGQLQAEGKLDIPAASGGSAPTDIALCKFREADPREIEEALRRLRMLDDFEKHGRVPDRVSLRTLQRWRSAARRSKVLYGTSFLGLLPKWGDRGNRNQLDPAVRELMASVAEGYDTSTRRTVQSVYGDLLLACERAGLVAPSYVTFCGFIKDRSAHETTKRREGAKAAYKYEEAVHGASLPVARHGDRPWEVAHIDHTEFDVELLHSRTGVPLGRPWATYLVDGFSRRVLAVVVGYDPPSYRSCMIGIRECVRRSGRMPETIWSDGGKEFQSIYYEQLLASFECVKKNRPVGKSRFGSVLERLIGTTNTELLYNLSGNTQNTKNVRQMTRAVDPRAKAVWTLPALSELLSNWAYELYDTAYHAELGCSPREAYERGWAELGERAQRTIPFDELFHILTCPSTRKGTALVRPGQGVLINYHYYWSPTFRDPRVEGAQVPVRYDPFDPSVAYAYASGIWVKCVANLPDALRGASEKVLRLVGIEIKKQHSVRGAARKERARQTALLVEEIAQREDVLRQRLKDEDARVIQGSAARSAEGSDARKRSGAPVAGPIKTRRIEEL